MAAIWVLTSSGCASAPSHAPGSVRDKLARVGLELVSENQAGIPPDRRGRYLPCRVIPGARSPALEPHPAGYLMVGVRGKRSEDAGVIRAALAAWRPGETLHLTIRRNPYRLDSTEWWESAVSLRLPDR